MSKRDGKHLRQRTTLFVLATLSPLLFAECSLILNDLPEPADAPNSSAGTAAGEPSANRGGKSGSGGAESTGGTGGITPAGGVGAGGMPTPAGGEGGNNATGGSPGDSGSGGTTVGDGGTGSGCPCDCDKDGALNANCQTGGGTADCDDEDDRVFPGQMQWFSEASLEVGFDYDCSGGTEQQYPVLECPAILAQCDETQEGFVEDTLCGDTGDWGSCVKGLTCMKVPKSPAPRRCH